MTRLGQLLRLMMASLMMYAIPAGAATWEDATGPFSTTVVAESGPQGTFYIHRPKTLAPHAHPIAVLCGGTGSHPRNYDALLAQLASHGVVVIADTGAYQQDGAKASAAVNWLVEQNETRGSDYFQKLVPSRVLAIGHSSGATGAMLASLSNSRITSLLLYAPGGSLQAPDISVPTFYISGALDTAMPPDGVKATYQSTAKASAWYGEVANQRHIGFATNPSVQYFTRAWVYTHLFSDSGTARGCFYGPDWTLQNAPMWKEKLKNNSAP